MSVRRVAAAGAAGALLLVTGCSHNSGSPSGPTTSASPSVSVSSAASAQDLMSEPWPDYTKSGPTMQPEVVSSSAPITLPKGTSTSPAGVPTGFPKTPEGALAQLKAIDEAALKNLNTDTARKVYTDSFEPSNPNYYQTGWMGPIADKMTGSATDSYTASLAVSQGLIRGTAESGNFAYVCTMGKLQIDTKASGSQTLPMPDCEGMRWNGSRWLAVPQSSVEAPNVSPHSSEAYKLGFRDLAV